MIEAIKPNKFRFEFLELVIWINLDSPSKARNQTQIMDFHNTNWKLNFCGQYT